MSENQKKDTLIVQLLQSGQMNDGFRLLVDSYQQRLYRHIRSIVKNHEDANDVVQNTFVKIFKGINGFNSDAKLYTWLYRIATNESLTFLRKQKKTEAVNGVSFLMTAAAFHDEESTIKNLTAAIGQLPEKQRAIFNLRYFEELSYKDISQITGTSEGGLKANYHHAVKKLTAYLKTNNIH